MPVLKLLDRRPDTDPVLTDSLADALRPHLPVRLRLTSSWTLLYSLDQHGISLSTLYQKVKGKGPCILAIKDANDQIFGGYLNEPLKPSPAYYGTGECFLWRATDVTNKDGASVRVYPWTGKNDYMVLSEPDFVAIGGGDGKFGLWLHSDLERGHTEECPTFDNEPLTSSRKFECVELEIWGFKP
ncbi:TLD-domain-containing protein [Umbelopsis sp. AD052]|nr:TLD-domain-containing protein [Umbelopsis sp. AD052]